jgi:hypothetical protein
MRRAYCQLFNFVAILVCVVGCAVVKPVKFETPVDTTAKQIDIQTKQTYHLQVVIRDFCGVVLRSQVEIRNK